MYVDMMCSLLLKNEPVHIFFSQFTVALSPLLAALSVGGVVGYPGVLLSQFRDKDSSIHLDLDTASWMGSIHGLAGIPSIFMPTLMQWRGRKFAFIAACAIIIIGWIIIYTASSATAILVSESFHGLGTNSILAVSLLSMSEMITPKYRNISMLCFSIIQCLGMALVGIMARYFHWRTISLVMATPIVLALLIAFIWPESPSWLACKGEFDKCARAFTLLRGNDENSKKELTDLIDAQKEIRIVETDKSKSVFNIIVRKDFYMPCFHMFVLLNSMYWSGVMVVIIYSKQLLDSVCSDEKAAHVGVILINLLLFVGQATAGFLVRVFNHKTVLLTSTFATAFSLLLFSLVSFLICSNVLEKSSILGVLSLVLCVIVSCMGLDSIVFTVSCELVPVKHRGLGGALFVIYTCVLHTSSLKISPYLFLYINLWGTFLIYAINALICGIVIWRYVPETKKRTLQEIENYYTYGKFVKKNKDEIEIMI